MTAIVGLVDADGTVYMGGDSAGTSNTGDQSVLLNQKIFQPEHGPWFLFGCCGEFRAGQVLQWTFRPPRPPGPDVNMDAFMVTKFVDSVKKCFEKAGLIRQDGNGNDIGHCFLVGYQGRVFKVEENFQVLSDRKNYTAVGSGESFALGALYATEGLAPADRVTLALQAAAHYHATVREPFTVKSLAFRHDWHKEPKKPKKNVAKR
jgi:hypothetical protein